MFAPVKKKTLQNGRNILDSMFFPLLAPVVRADDENFSEQWSRCERWEGMFLVKCYFKRFGSL